MNSTGTCPRVNLNFPAPGAPGNQVQTQEGADWMRLGGTGGSGVHRPSHKPSATMTAKPLPKPLTPTQMQQLGGAQVRKHVANFPDLDIHKVNRIEAKAKELAELGNRPLMAAFEEELENSDPVQTLVDMGHAVAQGVMKAGSAVWNSMPSVNLLTTAQAVPQRKAEPLGQGGVLMSEFALGTTNAANEARTHNDVARSLRRFIGKEKVHVVPNKNKEMPYLRNVVAEAPGKMVTTSLPDIEPKYAGPRDAVEQFFNKNGIKYERTYNYVNLANVDYIPSSDLLVLADIGESKCSHPVARAELERIFGNPTNLIMLELDSSQKAKSGITACYDLDLAFHATKNRDGKDVALIHKPCIVDNPTAPRMGRQQVLDTLRGLNFEVIEISAEDQANLATNCLSPHDASGRLLFSSANISESLRRDLDEHGITPEFPIGDRVLGAPGKKEGHFGIHCLTVNLRRPEREIAASRKAQEKKEL